MTMTSVRIDEAEKLDHGYYLYSETCFIHEGEISYLEEMIKESSSVGLNGIKFQIYFG